jgi:hypothetical protein
MDVEVGGLGFPPRQTKNRFAGDPRFGRRQFGLPGALGAERFEALEFGEGAAIKALGLSLIAEAEAPGVAAGGDAGEALAEEEISILLLGDLDAAGAGIGIEKILLVEAVHEAVEAGGKEAGFEPGGAEHGLLAQRHALNGEHLLGVDGLIKSDEVGAEVFDLADVLQADDGEGGGTEGMGAGGWLHGRYAPFLGFGGRGTGIRDWGSGIGASDSRRWIYSTRKGEDSTLSLVSD